MNSETPSLRDFVVPRGVVMSWLAYAAEKQLGVADIVQQAGLTTERTAGFSAGVSMLKFLLLMAAMHRHTGDDAVGFEVGWRMPPTTYGSLGHALLASANLQDALAVCQRFWCLLARGIVVNGVLRDGQFVLSFFLQFPLDGALRWIALESFMTSVYRCIVLLVPDNAKRIEIWFDHPEPGYSARIRERIPTVRFGMPLVQCRVPAELLGIPLPMASNAGQLVAIQQCELDERTLLLHGKYTARVQKELGCRAVGYPTLERIAGLMGMTERTLRRKLRGEGTRYSVLLDAARLRDAVLLLENPVLDIAQVAEHLGYNDPANFTRAFRKWTGVAPSQYRSRTDKVREPS